MKNLIKYKIGESSFVTYVKKRLKLNLNFICLFSGPTGQGKSYNAISFAEQLDSEFDCERQTTFNFQQTMDLINSEWLKQKKIKVIHWDEPQIEISNRAWQSQMNKLVNYLLSTFRSMNIILIFASPYKDFLDSQSMKLLHCEFKCVGWNEKTKLSRVLPRLLQYNPDKQRIYQHKLFVIRDSKAQALNHWDIIKPSDKNSIIYERRKAEFLASLNKDIKERLEDSKPKPKPEQPQSTIALTPLQEQILHYYHSGVIKQRDIAKQLSKTPQEVNESIKLLRKKGFYIRKYPQTKQIQSSIPKNSIPTNLIHKKVDSDSNNKGESAI